MSKRRRAVGTALVLGVAVGLLTGPAASAARPTPAPSTPAPPATFDEDLLDHRALVADLDTTGWYLENIPFLEVPDAQIQEIYYYRWSTLRRALKSTRPGTGYVINEFQVPVEWSARYGGIGLNQWHNNRDGRWLWNRQYLDQDTEYWINGVGTDENQNYTGAAADSVWQRYLVTGDRDYLTAQLPGLVTFFRKMESRRFAPDRGLYWEAPIADGTEFTIGSYQTDDPFAGGVGYRPTVNSYQYGDALAIARIARLVGDEELAAEFDAEAAALKTAVVDQLWDPERSFFFQQMRDNEAQEYGQHPNGGPRDPSLPILPEGTLLDGRELTGYIPWMFHLPDDTEEFSAAWEQLTDPEGFATPAGPATAERRHRLFDHEADDGCCRWNGPHWPMGTSQTLVAMANLLHEYANNTAVTRDDFYQLLRSYTRVQYRDGRPYVAEAADSTTGEWIYDAPDHSEHYNHSGYPDHVINGLLGVRPQEDDTLLVDPLIPDDWEYFALEHVPFRGHELSVVWDRTGERYGVGAGLQVRIDGELAASRTDVGALTVAAPTPEVAPYEPETNLASNPFDDHEDIPAHAFPAATASHTSPHDSPLRAVDGSVWYDPVGYGPNSRWTNWGSPNAEDWLAVDFGRPTPLSRLRLHFYVDEREVALPADYRVEYDGGDGWTPLPGEPPAPVANDVTQLDFERIEAQRIRVVVAPRPGLAVGLTEVEAFDPGHPPQLPEEAVQLVNASSELCVGVRDGSTAEGSAVTQAPCADQPAQRFAFEPTDSGYHRLVAEHSGQVLTIAGGGQENEAPAVTTTWAGLPEQQWRPMPDGYGGWTLVSRASSKALDVPGCRADADLPLQQWTNLANDCQRFVLR
ncbi:hypothetical protein FH609_008550 [Streptomyces sp. 3MP-14]|uniref:F5/8 type C domain-containing protein n=1 Tax=Streptomyces mimosae TaxID=2586635 RepID=A0A5N6ALI1_9ACTN|nr:MULTISPECIES: RICIN domain-containing protein [Streptomyces]KAB8168569.1 hypothetical protein FH607_004815 [Streptomyces mimosae]KAB8178149.1 hypothetical protein FH609_008550 [Streptomyces sp. 3MP-14]